MSMKNKIKRDLFIECKLLQKLLDTGSIRVEDYNQAIEYIFDKVLCGFFSAYTENKITYVKGVVDDKLLPTITIDGYMDSIEKIVEWSFDNIKNKDIAIHYGLNYCELCNKWVEKETRLTDFGYSCEDCFDLNKLK